MGIAHTAEHAWAHVRYKINVGAWVEIAPVVRSVVDDGMPVIVGKAEARLSARPLEQIAAVPAQAVRRGRPLYARCAAMVQSPREGFN